MKPFINGFTVPDYVYTPPSTEGISVYKCVCGRAWNEKEYLLDHIISEGARIDAVHIDDNHWDVSVKVSP